MWSQRTPENNYDLVVVGAGGLFGSSTLLHAAQIAAEQKSEKSLRILGLEQFQVNHTNGSSHGDSRITRVATGEGDEYVGLASRSIELLREVEAKTGETLCTLPGGMIIASETNIGDYHGSQKGFLQQTRECADKFKVPHQNLKPAGIRQQFPQFKVTDDESAYFEEKTMGFIRPDTCVREQLKLAQKAGAELHTGERLQGFEKLPDGKVRLRTINEAKEVKTYITNKLVLTAGSWTPELLKDKIQTELRVYRQTVYWFEVEESKREQFAVGKFPPFIWDGGKKKGIIYGFPNIDGNYIKIGSEKFVETTTPETVNRHVSADEVKEMYEKFIAPNFDGITSKCFKAMVCLYTVAPGHRFVIDYLPESDKSILFISACSGHGAKHSPAVGESVAQTMLGVKPRFDVTKTFAEKRSEVVKSPLRSKL